MRTASSYRGAKKAAAKEAGVPFSKFNEHYQRSRAYAASELERRALNMTPGAAQKALAIWAANGGRATAVSSAATPAAIAAINDQGLQDALDADNPVNVEKAVAAAKKLTAEDIDRAMEKALSAHQKAGHVEPLPLNPLFAARARSLHWVEGVEFVEEG